MTKEQLQKAISQKGLEELLYYFNMEKKRNEYFDEWEKDEAD